MKYLGFLKITQLHISSQLVLSGVMMILTTSGLPDFGLRRSSTSLVVLFIPSGSGWFGFVMKYLSLLMWLQKRSILGLVLPRMVIFFVLVVESAPLCGDVAPCLSLLSDLGVSPPISLYK